MKFIQKFLNLKTSTGMLLMAATILAIIFKNSALEKYYDSLINFPLHFSVLDFNFDESLLGWINDFLMAFFFLLIGMELKRECQEGYLKRVKDIMLPGIAAVGGVIIPALIYMSVTYHNSEALKGWAIPAATDIAFAMGILSLLGKRIPNGLRICLLSLAIFDDIAAIIIIAIFYASNISVCWCCLSLIPIFILTILNYIQINKITPYMFFGLILWLCVLKSGVHPTIAGILLGFFIPLKSRFSADSPLKKLEHALHPWVSFLILPIFAFFNAGVSFKNFSLTMIFHPITIAIGLGLFLGKQLGVMLFSFSAIKLKLCVLPAHTNWMQFYGMALLTGIGFTMSLFIGSLSFSASEYQNFMKLGIVLGSGLSGIFAYVVLWYGSNIMVWK